MYNKTIKNLISSILILILSLSLAACGGSEAATEPGQEEAASSEGTTETGANINEAVLPESEINIEPTEIFAENPVNATITMEDGGIISLELYPDTAPQSVCNFVYLARQGYYDGLKFHRIMNGFMIQGGCPEGIGIGGPGYSIKGEFSNNGITNELSHDRGVVSMARSRHYDSAGSQFFIVHGDSNFLDGDYAAFGRVVSGMDIVDMLAETPNSGPNGAVAAEDMPVIKSITIDSDIGLPEPNKIY